MLQLEGSMQFPYIQFKGAYINYLISKLLTPTIMFMFNATIKTAVSAFSNLKDQAIYCNLIWFTTFNKTVGMVRKSLSLLFVERYHMHELFSVNSG